MVIASTPRTLAGARPPRHRAYEPGLSETRPGEPGGSISTADRFALTGTASTVLASLGLGFLAFVALASTDRSPTTALVGGLVMAFAPLAAAQPMVFLAGYGALAATHIDEPMKNLGIPSPWILAQGLAALHLGVLWRRGELRLSWSVVHTMTAVFFATRVLGLLVASNTTAATNQIVQIGKDCIALFVVASLLASVGGVRWFIAGICGALGWLALIQEVALVGLGEFHGFNALNSNIDVGSATLRHAGPLADPNFWGRLLVLFFPLAVAALVSSRTWWMKALSTWSMVGFLAGIYLSQSRGAFIAAIVGVGVFLLASGWRLARWTILAPAFVLVLFANPLTGPRLETLLQLGDTTSSNADLSLVARQTAVKAGTEMFLEHPLLGIGTGNFTDQSVTKQRELGARTNENNAAFVGVAAHNSYLETAAETGVIGLVSLLLLFGAVGVLALRSLTRMRALATVLRVDRDEMMVAALLAGLVAYCLASMFLHLVLFAPFLVLAALVVDADRQYSEVLLPGRSARRVARPSPWVDARRVGTWLVALTAATLLMVLVVPWHRSTWVATVGSTISARPGPEEWIRTYELELASRSFPIGNTLGKVLVSRNVRNAVANKAGLSRAQLDRYTFEAFARPRSTLIDVAVRGPDPVVAGRLASGVFVDGAAVVNALGSPFVIEALSDPTASVSRERSARLARLALLVAPLLLVVGGLIFVDRQRRYSAAVVDGVAEGTIWCT
jgi:O-antigen ligase